MPMVTPSIAGMSFLFVITLHSVGKTIIQHTMQDTEEGGRESHVLDGGNSQDTLQFEF